MESIDRIERMKDRIEDLQEQDFERYKFDIADTIALRVWQKHNGILTRLSQKNIWRLRVSILLTQSALWTDPEFPWDQATHRTWLGTQRRPIPGAIVA